MSTQSYSNHRRYVPGFHFLSATLCVIILIGAIVNLCHLWNDEHGHMGAAILVLVSVVLCLFFWFIRSFALRAQDRAIRAEEKLRHFILTGKPLDSRLRMGQIIALRFAGDGEFADLARKAAEENLRSNEIKKLIQNWRPDFHRV